MQNSTIILVFAGLLVFFAATCLAEAYDNDVPGFKQQIRERLYRDLLQSYNSHVIPVNDDHSPVTVSHSLSVNRILGFDDDKILHLDVVMTMFWMDDRLRWNPDEYGGIEITTLPVRQIWTPDLVLWNNVEDPKPLPGAIGAVVSYNGQVIFTSPLKVKSFCDVFIGCKPNKLLDLTCKLKYSSWVYNGLELDIQLISNGKQGELLQEFVADFNEDWTMVSFTGERNQQYADCCKEPIVDVTYSAVLRRQ